MVDTPEGPSTATVFRIVYTAAAALLTLYALYILRSVVILVLVAAFLAVGLDPAVRRLQSWGLKRGQAVVLMLLIFLLVSVGFLAAIVPPLIRQVGLFATDLPDYVDELADKNARIAEFVSDQNIAERLSEATSNIPKVIGASAGRVFGFAGSIIANIFNALTVIVFTIYFSVSLAEIHAGSMRLVPKSKRARVQELADPILTKIGSYIAGNIAISVVAGVLAFIFLTIARVPFAGALALWVGIADLIPMVGATVGAIPAVIVAFFTSIPLGIATLVYFIIYQQFENYFIAPRVMTKAVDLSPAAVLLAALAGAALLGMLGALMAIPLAAGIKLLAQELIVPKAEQS